MNENGHGPWWLGDEDPAQILFPHIKRPLPRNPVNQYRVQIAYTEVGCIHKAFIFSQDVQAKNEDHAIEIAIKNFDFLAKCSSVRNIRMIKNVQIEPVFQS